MSVKLDGKRLRIVLYEGDGAEPLEPQRRFETLLGLLEDGHSVTRAAPGGTVVSADRADHLVIGQFTDKPADIAADVRERRAEQGFKESSEVKKMWEGAVIHGRVDVGNMLGVRRADKVPEDPRGSALAAAMQAEDANARRAGALDVIAKQVGELRASAARNLAGARLLMALTHHGWADPHFVAADPSTKLVLHG